MPGPWDSDTPGKMIVTTTPTVEGRPAAAYLGLVSGEAIMGANMVRDLFAGITDMIGGRSGTYENVLRSGRDQAISEMIEAATELGANAVVGVGFSYAAIGANDSMMLVSATGTAVTLA